MAEQTQQDTEREGAEQGIDFQRMAKDAVEMAWRNAEETELVRAQDAQQALVLALTAAGLEFPHLSVDACDCGRMPSVQRVELGDVKAETALRLAEAIANGVMG